MKIAVISTSKIPSTTANSIQVMKVCQSYRQLGIDVRLFVPGEEKISLEDIKTHYGITEGFPIRWIQSYQRLNRYDFVFSAVFKARQWGCDIVHTWTPQAALLARMLNIPYLMELHELPSGKFGPAIIKRVIQNSKTKRFLIITEALKKKYEEFYAFPFPHQEVVIAPDGVDLERYIDGPSPAEARQRLNLPEKLTALYTGHLYPGRGMNILIALAEGFPDVQFLWVGGNFNDVNYWKTEIKNRGLENIILTGFIKNQQIPLYQAAGEILLMPYEKKISGSSGGNTVDICSPMKMFEYMAAKRAILSSDLPVLHEVLSDKMAIFCSPDEVNDWIVSFSSLVNDREKRNRLAINAFNEVEQYTWINRAGLGIDGLINEP